VLTAPRGGVSDRKFIQRFRIHYSLLRRTPSKGYPRYARKAPSEAWHETPPSPLVGLES
jgi:hypothetical protein